MSPLDPAGMRIAVAGMGVTGQAVEQALRPLGASLVLLDDRDDPAFTKPDAAAIAGVDLVIASPGWEPDHPVFTAAHAAGVEVLSELDLAWELRTRPAVPWLVVTGTNGKTTTTQMLAAMLRQGGRTVAAVGNIGDPLITAALNPDYDVVVVEASSFQLHHTSRIEPLAAVCLNVAADHLDWHGGWQGYVADKARVYHAVRGTCLYNADDPVTRTMVANADVAEGTRAVGFTVHTPQVGELGLVDDLLVDRAFGEQRQVQAHPIASLADLRHLGTAPHLIANALGAAGLALAAGVDREAIAPALREFQLDAHRMAPVPAPGEISFIDDSKATNAHAAAAALSGMQPGTVVWIAGGLAKGATFDDLVEAHRDKLRGVVLIGTDPSPLLAALTRHAPGIPRRVVDGRQTETVMLRAVNEAIGMAQPGDTVLLAPACASMDQFASYAARGQAFVQAVAERVR